MKTNVSPLWLTYHMMKWDGVKQTESDQRRTLCGRALMRTEILTDDKGIDYVGYVCHPDKHVTWVRITEGSSP